MPRVWAKLNEGTFSRPADSLPCSDLKVASPTQLLNQDSETHGSWICIKINVRLVHKKSCIMLLQTFFFGSRLLEEKMC